MHLWVILYFSGFKSYQMKGSQFWQKDYFKVKTVELQKIQKTIVCECALPVYGRVPWKHSCY